MKRFLFYCAKCDFEYSGGSEEPCSCSLCGKTNECCYIEEIDECCYIEEIDEEGE